jgi:hypothetical protein
VLNNQPMGFCRHLFLVGDAKRHGVPILPLTLRGAQRVARSKQVVFGWD